MNSAVMEHDVNEIGEPRLFQRPLVQLALTSVVLIVFQFALAGLNDLSPSAIWAILSLLGYFVFGYQLVATAPATVIILLPLLIFRTTEIISCVAIESGALMHEIQQVGFPTGGTARLAIVMMTFFFVGAMIVEPAWSKSDLNSNRDRIESYISLMTIPIAFACCFFYLYMIYVGLRFGFPLLSGADRFDFRFQVSDPIYSSLSGNRHLFIAALSLLSTVPRQRKLACGLFGGMFLISVLFGEKFGPIVVMSAIFPSAGLLLYLNTYKKLPIARMAFFGTLIGSLAIVACLNVYAYGADFEVAKTKLLDRMAEQGEMWYVGDRDYRFNAHVDWHTISQDISACLGRRSQDQDDIGTDFGPFFVMQSYADKYYLKNGQEKGIYFAFTYSTYWLMVSGYTGLAIVSFLTSIAYGYAGRLFMVALVNGNYLGAILGQKLMILVQTALVTGYSFYVFGYKTFIFFAMAWVAIYGLALWKTVTRQNESDANSNA